MMTMLRALVRFLFLIVILWKLMRILRRFHIFKRIEFLKSIFLLLWHMRSSIPWIIVMRFFFLESVLRWRVIVIHMIACFKAVISTTTVLILIKMAFLLFLFKFYITFNSIGISSLWIGFTSECWNILLD